MTRMEDAMSDARQDFEAASRDAYGEDQARRMTECLLLQALGDGVAADAISRGLKWPRLVKGRHEHPGCDR